ncbi:alkylhydroperoxidase [Halostagnicola sp. A56]|uniref:carboxymuconolactone decarboxylase family protein n=1 Tax=Halostagnicola sp. A56 TaxID=1495067 RepID=UPI0004A164C0|nr:carboxymuconolactone decarboxylase family protein [Halostagnicola sp. A56]KDE58028.1 alkylhydroperoxidase [Halostagnicola sp. A56]
MVSNDTADEIQEYLGVVPSWIEALPDAAADHSWNVVRDLQLGETDLTRREKALVGVGASAAIQCPYCIHFHREEAKLEEVTEAELAEAFALAGNVRYFSTVLHGVEMDHEEFEAETESIVDHINEQQAQAADDD